MTTTDKAPSGAMWYADWMEEYYRGMDGHSLVVRTPAGDWYIDGPSSSGGKWARQGDVPVVTVSPSIVISELRNPYGVVLMPGYHGWLREGRLLEL